MERQVPSTLGLVCAVAARCYFDYISNWYAEHKEDGFAHKLFRCASLSLQLARELSPQLNDVILWLAYEVMQCCTSLEGSASLSVWRKLSDVVTDMYALGLHREAALSDESMPFFLSEYRRRFFAIIFNFDKAWSAIFNQPPRVPSRYADCKPPLDLSEDDLFTLQQDDLGQLLRKLTPNGWNKDGGYRTTTWTRLRYTVGGIREQFIEAQFHLTQPVDGSELRNLSVRCHEAWNSLPQHLRYGEDPNQIPSDLPNIIRQILMRAHLTFVHIDFHIIRSISRGSSAVPSPELLEISARMLQGVIMCVMERGNKPFLCDLAEDLLFYALPSAVVLITALQDAVRDPARSLPPSISKPTLFRNLSVLVSQLEALASPEEPHYTFCAQAAKSMSRKLDQVLEHSMAGPGTAIRAGNPSSNGNKIPGDLQQGGASIATTAHRPGGEQQPGSEEPALGPPGDVATPCMGLSDFDSNDFETWATNWGFDMGTTTSEWGMF
ncbi:hypothetical protein M406DRAFT_351718 [Cryphonectria parasitica EP155]|uniref:Transcription factor domain-containing protein n=1 Tax=Cryphonectria parasitica (strain ATCC 38755 / EP155) TaxID=660469 RepID=A0A9P4Y0H1_CRYP1|nr:uncharacterized protein M406DRAFT_351718 [Cryphonectria parasitica EP155]KAF3764413.1 hypothetical protein M406DRAFT_351718 [Cryphonectria parasitica EP155]